MLFLSLSPFAAILGTIWVYQTTGVHWATWVLAFVMLYATGCGIGAGYHRLFSHRAYVASWPVRLFLLFFGAAALEGSVKHWCSQHRDHHRYVDTNRDPYNIKRGFLYAHMGWVVVKPDYPVDYKNIPDIERDRLADFQHRFYLPIAIGISFLLPALVASLWGNFWAGFFIAGMTRVVVNHHFTFLINSYCHYFGKQTFTDQNTARDSGFIAFFTYGEGYHNFHHMFETDYRNGYRAWHWDPNKWIIFTMAKLGLADRLRRTDAHRVLAARLAMEKLRVSKRLSLVTGPDSVLQKVHCIVDQAYIHLDEAHQRLRQLRRQYQELKQGKIQQVQHNYDALKAQLLQAKEEFYAALAEWRSIVKMEDPLLLCVV